MQNLFRHARSGSSRTGDTGRLLPRLWLGLLLVPIVAGTLLVAGTVRAAGAGTYDCGVDGGGSGVCSNQIQLKGQSVTGVQTTIRATRITSGCSIKNAVSLTDSVTNMKVEAGIISEGGDPVLYWGDMENGKFVTHLDSDNILNTDDLGKFAHIKIFKTDSNAFDITIDGLSNASLSLTITFIDEPFNPDMITIGTQLCGTSEDGASAPWTDFTNNQYQDPMFGSWHQLDSQNAPVLADNASSSGNGFNPIYGEWEPAGTSNNDGDFHTCIIGNGCPAHLSHPPVSIQ